jgi:hypothetical protein
MFNGYEKRFHLLQKVEIKETLTVTEEQLITIFFFYWLCVFYLLMEARKLGRVGVGLSISLSP